MCTVRILSARWRRDVADPVLLPSEGKLPRNIAHFARALRKAGLPIGPGRVIDAIRAVATDGVASISRLADANSFRVRGIIFTLLGIVSCASVSRIDVEVELHALRER